MKSEIVNKILIAVAIALLTGCCKKEGDYTLTNYAKSWISSYQGSTVIFKNEFDKTITYSYTDTQLNISTFHTEGDCPKHPQTTQYSTTDLKSSELAVTFNITLYSYSEFYGSPTDENLSIIYSGPGNYPGWLYFENDTVSYLGSFTYFDSITINNSTFHQVYADYNNSSDTGAYKVLSFYLTKQQGIVAFETDSATWVLQK